MPPRKKTLVTFDEHLGAVVDGLARPHGGREFLAGLLGWSPKTVERRVTGLTPFLVKEIEIVARKMNTTSSAIAEQALRNFSGGGTEDEGIEKLLAEEGLMSEPPASLDDQRNKKTPAEMTEEEMMGERNAANHDPEIGFDEPDPA